MRSWLSAAACAAILVVTGSPAASAAAPAATRAAVASVPRPDHVVVVIEENHAEGGIIGNADAPFITSLAAQNANFTQSYAETHPSEPNYLALYSGSTQGLTDDSCPHTYSAPDLGSGLAGAGYGFTGYSEDLPSAGSAACTSGNYVRKHNPWVNFPAVPAAANQPFSAFPTDYSTLPAVSFVVPNLQDDMHDGTIAQGDNWLQNNLGSYIDWAKTHNSLFVLTFDEDDGGNANRVPTIFAGQRVASGSYPETINHYNVLRTLSDAFGIPASGNAATATPITDVWSPPSGDQPPTAAFSSTCTALTCAFDGSASADADGTVAGYSWNFGDGTTGTGATPSHTYAATGTYAVTLAVADDQGASGSTTQPVGVTAPAGSAFLNDSFNRTVGSGWGSADLGGAYKGTGSPSSVSGGAGVLVAAAGKTIRQQSSTTSSDADVTTTLSVDRVPTGGPTNVKVIGRQVSAGNEYGARIVLNTDQSVTLQLTKMIGNTETALTPQSAVAGLTYNGGSKLSVRLQVTGINPTTVRARMWTAGSTEPSAWKAAATDSTAALQAAGSVGLQAYLPSGATNGPVTTSFFGLTARTTVGAPVDQPPTPAFTTSCAQLSCSFDGTGSTDPDGTVSSYAWNFGDGATGSAATPVHAFVTAGTYPVQLTVTDNAGAAASTTRQVTVTAPPPEQPPSAVFTASCTQLSCSFDGSASNDNGAPVTGYAWDFGDNATAGVAAPTHTYAAAGTYSVSLVVTGSDGDTGSVTQQLSVSAAPPAVAADQFARTVARGWGTADTGGAWTVSGSVTGYSVSPGVAAMSLAPGSQRSAWLASTTTTDANLTTSVTVNTLPSGDTVYPTVLGRQVGSGNEYDARLTISAAKQVYLWLTKTVNGVDTTLVSAGAVSGVTAAPGKTIDVRLQVSGASPTTVRARAWAAGTTEPTAWKMSATDSTPALQTAGSVGLRGYLSGAAASGPVVLGWGPIAVVAGGG